MTVETLNQALFSFEAEGTEELRDSRQKLIWRVKPELDGQEMTWPQAVAHAWQEAKNSGFNWRLPTVEELSNLVRVLPEAADSVSVYDLKGTHSQTSLKKGDVLRAEGFLHWDTNTYWTGSPVAGRESRAWVVLFGNGDVFHHSHDYTYCVRLVRSVVSD